SGRQSNGDEHGGGQSAALMAGTNVVVTVVGVSSNLTVWATNGSTYLTNLYVGGNLTNHSGDSVYAEVTNFVGGSAALYAGTNGTLSNLVVGQSLVLDAANGNGSLNQVLVGSNLTAQAGGNLTVTNTEVGQSAALMAGTNVVVTVAGVSSNLTV